jgi:acyl-CoA thioesterase-1
MNSITGTVTACLLALLLPPAGCDRDEDAATARATPATLPAEARQPGGPDSGGAGGPDRLSKRPRVVFLGDSLTAGLGLDAEQAFPAVVGGMLRDEGLPVEVVNAGVSGDTTAGGLRRLDWLLKQSPDVVVVGLGGNDGLRGLELKASEQNLREIVRKCRGAGADVLLLGMLIPPNYGPEYTLQFRDLYPRVAKDLNVPLVPFVLEGVGGDARLNQPDGIHPTDEGHQVIAKNVLPHLRTVVRARVRNQ